MLRLTRLLALALGLILICTLSSRQVSAADQDAAAIATGLQEFFELADGLAAFEEFAEPIPLTALDPSAKGVLDLDSVLADSDDDNGSGDQEGRGLGFRVPPRAQDGDARCAQCQRPICPTGVAGVEAARDD